VVVPKCEYGYFTDGILWYTPEQNWGLDVHIAELVLNNLYHQSLEYLHPMAEVAPTKNGTLILKSVSEKVER
jgi:hypothetical protein